MSKSELPTSKTVTGDDVRRVVARLAIRAGGLSMLDWDAMSNILLAAARQIDSAAVDDPATVRVVGQLGKALAAHGEELQRVYKLVSYWAEQARKWEASCTGKHGSQMPCVEGSRVETTGTQFFNGHLCSHCEKFVWDHEPQRLQCKSFAEEPRAESDCSTGVGGVTLVQMAENIKHGLDPYAGSSEEPSVGRGSTCFADDIAPGGWACPPEKVSEDDGVFEHSIKCNASSRTPIDGPGCSCRHEKAGARCDWGCHVHWSGWPASHHPNCTVNGT